MVNAPDSMFFFSVVRMLRRKSGFEAAPAYASLGSTLICSKNATTLS